ncbi:hypothetical protein CANCADRAFT_24040 [Tortispora caseinolytica NRRL Y-17796]|uniref:Cell cycle control protein n=1 Tax=Tortispora caseinolytica NRRL Y-17796 TaxID=767744 RepID=A0A1E4TG64_9ASCO|nr:hypothetical protein CANCADRAFT_24040 [Tortispora caseinolytica NRRL Y-17796]
MAADSVHEDTTEKKKSRRPPNTAFRQQRLKAWQPILSPKTVLPLFFALGAIFAPLGGALLYAGLKAEKIQIDYTYCGRDATTVFSAVPTNNVEVYMRHEPPSDFNPTDALDASGKYACRIQFDLPSPIGPDTFLYYHLTNFYQNHRRYVRSFDEDQLEGSALTAAELQSNDQCTPLIMNEDGIPYYPCGLIANSQFNDTYTNPILLNPDASSSSSYGETYYMTNKDISWPSSSQRFRKTEYNYTQVVPPPNWALRYPDGYTEENFLDLSTAYELQNWMEISGLPAFSKLALVNRTATMQSGTYQIDAALNFPAHVYGGTKSILISTTTVVGGYNPFLGIAYLVVAAVCLLLGTIFLLRHLIKPRRIGDHTYLSWGTDAHNSD